MSAFLRALTGKVSIQDQVSASVRERTQASSFSQTVYGGNDTGIQKSSAFSKLIAYFKANPVIAWVSGSGLAVVIVLCVLLPIILSGGKNPTPTGGGSVGDIGSSDIGDPDIGDPDISDPDIGDPDIEVEDPPVDNAPDETPDTSTEPSDPSVSTVQMETRDLGILNASIDIPSDYAVSEDGFTFVNADRGCAIMANFVWNIGVPVYSLSDVATNREMIVSSVMTELEVTDYTILTAGPDSIGSQEAYQICFEGTDKDGVSMELIYMAIQGSNPFGCYSVLGAYPLGDEAGKEEVYEILQTFQSNGVPDTTYSMWYSDNVGIKIIIDDSIALGSVWETEIQLENGVAKVIVIYPTQAAMDAGLGNIDSPDSGGVEVGYVSEYGYSTPEELLNAHVDSAIAAGGTVGERYTVALGGAEWLCQDYTISSFNFSSAAAVIDGQCFYMSAMYNASNQEAVIALCNQVLASVRPW